MSDIGRIREIVQELRDLGISEETLAAIEENTGVSEFVEEWDVYRDENGNPITITEKQMYAIWHAIHVVEMVRTSEEYDSMWKNPRMDLYKSRLLGRMLLHGLPPTRTKPPIELGGPAWHLLPGGDPF